jgi:hypothetical protein
MLRVYTHAGGARNAKNTRDDREAGAGGILRGVQTV